MPDTHLAMPRSLSADQAQTLEAAPLAPMTTSDASPNGTAAAAAAFARILVSGDQAMQSETQRSNDFSAEECKPLSLRDVLLGTVSPFADLLHSTRAASRAHWADDVDMVHGDRLKATQAPWTRFHALAPSTPILSLSDVIAAITQARAELEMDPNEGNDALFRSIGLLRRVQEATQAFAVGETSIIPVLGMTFRQAADRVRELLDWNEASGDRDPDEDGKEAAQRRSNSEEYSRLQSAIFAFPCVTIGDMLVKVERMADSDLGVDAIGLEAEQTAQLRADLQHLTARPDGSNEHVADPALTAYLEWVAAANEANRTANEASNLPEGSPEWEAVNEACCNAEELSNNLMEEVVNSTATSPAGVLAKFAYFTWITGASMTQGDIKLWSGMIADIARLGVFPLETKEVAPFGEGRRFGPLHRAAMAKEGIDPSGHPVALPSSLWEPPADLPQCNWADAKLLAAFEDYCSAALRIEEIRNEDDPEQKAAYERKWAAQDFISEASPQTPAGLVAFLKVAFQNVTESITGDDAVFNGKPMPDDEHAGMGGAMIWRLITMLDPTARSIPTSEEVKAPVAPETDSLAGFDDSEKELLSILPQDGKHALLELSRAQLALQEAVGHARKAADGRLWIAGRFAVELRRDADDLDTLGTTPHPDAALLIPGTAAGSTLPAIYAEWRKVQARYLSNDLPDDQSDEAEKALDYVEDRLALEPVRCATDVFVKLAAFFSEMVRIGSVPLINADSDKTWPRLLPITEQAVNLLPAETQEPFQAMMQGIRGVVGILDMSNKASMHRPMTTANDQQPDVDAFADTVAAFQDEAPITLALPLEPTGRMVDAAASAAGITPKQFQAAYAAAVEALKLERAA